MVWGVGGALSPPRAARLPDESPSHRAGRCSWRRRFPGGGRGRGPGFYMSSYNLKRSTFFYKVPRVWWLYAYHVDDSVWFVSGALACLLFLGLLVSFRFVSQACATPFGLQMNPAKQKRKREKEKNKNLAHGPLRAKGRIFPSRRMVTGQHRQPGRTRAT